MKKGDNIEYLGVKYIISLIVNGTEMIIVNKSRKISKKVLIENTEL